MQSYLDLVWIGPGQALPILVALVLWTGLAAIGVLFTNTDRFVEASPIFGWAIISGVFTVVGIIFREPFFILACAVALLSLFSIYQSIKLKRPLFIAGLWRVLVLALPLLWIAAAMEPSQWDEFSHWLPAPRYLLEFNGFPTKERPFFGPHMLSAYPYGWPFLSYLSALIADQFIPNITSTLNLFLLLTFSTFALRTALRISGKDVLDYISWPFATAAAIFATLFNPTFIQKIVLTSYSDTSTSVLVGFGLLIGYYFTENLANRRPGSSWSYAWQLSLVLSLLLNVRQANLVLVVVLLIAIFILIIRDPNIPFGFYLKHLVFVLIPVLVVYASWRYHVASEFNLFQSAEANFRPFERWNFAEIPQILAQMGYVAFKKIGFFGPLLVACYFGIKGLLRFRTSFDRISILIAVVFLGYTTFLFLTYLGHFQAKSAIQVVSFWRYSTHNGMVAVAFLTIGIMFFLNSKNISVKYPYWLKTLALALIILLPFGLAHKIRFDLEAPKPYFTTVAKDVGGIVSKDKIVFVVDPVGTGESAKITDYYLNQYSKGWISAFTQPTLNKVRLRLNQVSEQHYVLVHSLVPGLAEYFGLILEENKSYLFVKDGIEWRLVKDWHKVENN